MSVELRQDGSIKLTNYSFKEILEELQPYIKQGYTLLFTNDDWPISYSSYYECVVVLEQPEAVLEKTLKETPNNDNKADDKAVKTTVKQPQKPRGRGKQPNPTA